MTERVEVVRIEDVVVPEIRVRSLPTEELRESLSALGVAEPIVVCYDAKGVIAKEKYILIDGEQRLSFLRSRGERLVRARIVGECTHETIYYYNVVYSLRGDVDWLSFLRTIHYLRFKLGWSVEKIAAMISRGRKHVMNMLSVAREIDSKNLWDRLPRGKPLRWYLEKGWEREAGIEFPTRGKDRVERSLAIVDAPPPHARSGLSIVAIVMSVIKSSMSSDVKALVRLYKELVRLAAVIEDALREGVDIALRGAELAERAIAEVKRRLVEVKSSRSSR